MKIISDFILVIAVIYLFTFQFKAAFTALVILVLWKAIFKLIFNPKD